MTHSLPLLDLVVLLAYLAAVVGLGCGLVRKSRDTQGFMAAGGSLPGWVVGLSIFGTYVSSISFVANPGKSFTDNWNPFVFSLSLPLAALIAVRVFVPLYRRIGEVSAYAQLEHRFGLWARTYAVVCYLLTQMARVGTILYLVALMLNGLIDWPIEAIIISTGVLVTVYTMLGGIEAVIWTDAVQSVVLTLGILVSCVVLLCGMPEGPGQLFQIAVQHHKFSLGSFGPSFTEPTFWVVLLYGLFINLQNFGIDQSYVQRYITACSEPAAARSVWIGALLYIPVSALLFFIGTALFAFYQSRPDLLPAGDVLLAADEVFPYFIITQLPTGLTGLLIAGVLAAAMSSVDSSLNSSSSLMLCDVYRRYFRPQASERESMRVLHVGTVLWGAIGTGMALAMINVKGVLDAWWSLAGLFSGGMLGLFLLGLISKRAGNIAAISGVIAGVIVILWMSLSPQWAPESGWGILRNPLHGFLTIVCGTLTILLVGLTIAALRPEHSQSAVSLRE